MSDEQWQAYLDSLDGGMPFPRHTWEYGGAIRQCSTCGEREAYWDDEDYPIDPCRAAVESTIGPES